MPYVGAEAIPKASRTLTEGSLGTSSQTFTVPGGYRTGNIHVYINGSRLSQSDYDDSSGTEIDLLEQFPQGTEYVVEEIRSFTIPDHYTKSEIENSQFDFAVMPTFGGDDLIESGSNSDGEWTRYADGTQIVSSSDSTIQTITEPMTNSLYRTTNLINFTFPVAFTSAIRVFSNGVYQSGTASFMSTINAPSTTGASFYLISSANNAEARATLMAIGRWK